jgi:hypothetical protein
LGLGRDYHRGCFGCLYVSTHPKKSRKRQKFKDFLRDNWVPGRKIFKLTFKVQIVGIIVGIIVVLALAVFVFIRFQAIKMAT